MGADLTMEKGGAYFRDSYNETNSWWLVGLSYWEMSDQLTKNKELTEDGYVKVKGVNRICKRLAEAKVPSYEVWLNSKLKDRPSGAKKGKRKDTSQERELYDWLVLHFTESMMFWNVAKKKRSRVAWSV